MTRTFTSVVRGRIAMLFLSETALIFAAFLAAVFADPDIQAPTIFLVYESGLERISVVICAIVLGLYLRGFYSKLRVQSRVFLFLELCMIFGVALVAQGILGYVHRDWTAPRKVMLAGSVLGVLATFAWRLLVDRAARGAVEAKPMLFLGLSPTAVQLANFFHANPDLGYAPAGYLESSHTATPAPASMARLGTIDDLTEVVDSTRPNSIVIGRREDIQPGWTHEFLELRFSGVNAEQAATLYEKTFGRVCVAEIWPSKMIFGGTWKTRPVDVMVQTLYSSILAPVGLILMLPVMAVIAILIKLGSPGPVLLRETRIGMHNEPFSMYRFRCSRYGAGGNTALGVFLHRFGLDVLPQLFNIVRGQMAVVGPQPDRPEFAQWLGERIPFYRQRQEVKPGVTGWAKIHYDAGAPETDVLQRLEYDLYYVKKLSPVMDSLVLLLSWKSALFGNKG